MMTFQKFCDQLQLPAKLTATNPLFLIKTWSTTHVSGDVEFEGDQDEQYEAYLAYIEHYLDVFLPYSTSLTENITAFKGMNSIQYASQQGYDHFIKHLPSLESAVFNQANKDGMAPLHLAAIGGHLSTFEALLARGADPTQANTAQELPVHCALFVPGLHEKRVFHNKEQIYNDLAAQAPQTLSKKDPHGNSVAHLMVKYGFHQLLSGLTHQLDPMVFSPNDQTRYPIHAAVLNGNLDIARLLLQAGSAELIDAEGRCALHYAAKQGNVTMLQLCAEFTDINARDSYQKTALILAAESNHAKVIQAILTSHPSSGSVDYKGHPALDQVLELLQTKGNTRLIDWVQATIETFSSKRL